MLSFDVKNAHGIGGYSDRESHSDLLTYQHQKGTNQGISSAMASVTKVHPEEHR